MLTLFIKREFISTTKKEERYAMAAIFTMEDIIESNRLKTNALEAVKSDMQGIMSQAELDKLEQVFMSVTKGYVFKRKEV